MYNLCVLDEVAQQLCRSRALAIVEGGSDVEQRLVIGQVGLSSRKDSTLFMCFLLRPLADLRNLDGQFIEREVFGRGQTTTQRDDTRLLEVFGGGLERVAFTRRGFDVQAVYLRSVMVKATRQFGTHDPISWPWACEGAASRP